MVNEDYKKLYESALERAKDIAIRGREPKDGALSACQYIFPQLKESEDERIRKDLIQTISQYTVFAHRDPKDIIAWLEKQGEQKKFNEDKFLREHITEDSISDVVNSRLTKCGWYVSENKWSTEDIYNWLKSLKPQNSWKPTKEQMDNLEYAINTVDKCCENSLQSLYDQLKKL